MAFRMQDAETGQIVYYKQSDIGEGQCFDDECMWVTAEEGRVETVQMSDCVEICTDDDAINGGVRVVESETTGNPESASKVIDDFVIEDTENNGNLVILSEEECKALETYGYVILNRNGQGYLLDGDGIKELASDLTDDPTIKTNENDLSVIAGCIEDPSVEKVQRLHLSNEKDFNQGGLVTNIEESLYKANEVFDKTLDYNHSSQQNTSLQLTCENECTVANINYVLNEGSQVQISENSQLTVDKKDHKVLLGQEANGKQIYGRIIDYKPPLVEESSKTNQQQLNIFDTDTKEISNESKQYQNKIFLGKTLNGKEIYGHVIDFKSADGSEMSYEKLCKLSGKIIGDLAQILISGKSINDIQVGKVTENKNDGKEMSEQIIIYNNEYEYISNFVIKNIETINVYDISSDKIRGELEIVKRVLKSLVSAIKPSSDYSDIFSKALKIHKNYTAKNEKGNYAIVQELIFKGRMCECGADNWEFLSSAELQGSFTETMRNDFFEDCFNINISTDEKFQHHILLGSTKKSDANELERELQYVKCILQRSVPLMKNKSMNELELFQSYLKVHKTAKNCESENAPLKESIFIGKMYKSNEFDWEFVNLPTLEEKLHEIDFITVKIVIDEETNGAEVKFMDLVKNKSNRMSENTEVEDDAEQKSTLIPNQFLKFNKTAKINGRKHYECGTCKKLFYGLINFKRHEKIHLAKEDDPTMTIFKCPLCECVFCYQSTCTRHLINAHRGSHLVQTVL